MPLINIVASLPQIKTRRAADDLVRELRIHGLKIVSDGSRDEAAARLLSGESTREDPDYAPRMVVT